MVYLHVDLVKRADVQTRRCTNSINIKRKYVGTLLMLSF